MKDPRPPWHFAAIFAALLVVCAGVFIIVSRRPVPAARLVQYLPFGDRVLISIDGLALRKAGLIKAVPSVAEEADYRDFVQSTGFNYQRHLDHLYLSVGNNETHAWVVGRFDWKRLQAYAKSHGGDCRSVVCRLDSPTPGRKISFRRNGSGILALASSANPDAVQRLFTKPATAPPPEPPPQPVWFLLPHATLQTAASMPDGSRMFLSAISTASHAFIAIGAKENGFQATLDALAPNDQEAQQAVRELQAATTVLNRMLAREKQTPNPRDLSGVLTRGEFSQQGVHIKGAWPIERSFLESINLAGSDK
ncbi:MAG: hypothetical protein HY820_13325 [Acidobacteria bacterium]|nr:hypothetical protein [Acidobacteriota bacterium]